jgi:hypothetical protein
MATRHAAALHATGLGKASVSVYPNPFVQASADSIALNPPSQGPNSTTVDMVLQYIYKVNGPLGTTTTLF